MKKTILSFTMASLLLIGGMNLVVAQEQPSPKPDTVNMDTYAKPTFYYAEEDKPAESKGSASNIAIIAGVVVVAAAVGFFLVKKNKKN
jgi:LPXTG-motif cell wall-anchored protein